MITVIYEYSCDNCGDEVHARQRATYHPGDTIAAPETRLNTLQGEMLCGDCAQVARKGLESGKVLT